MLIERYTRCLHIILRSIRGGILMKLVHTFFLEKFKTLVGFKKYSNIEYIPVKKL